MKWLDRINRVASDVSVAALTLLVVLILFDALSRYLFHSGSIALQELEWHLFDAVILLGIGYTLHVDKHVRVDIFYERFSERTKAWVDLLALVAFVLPFSALIVSIGYGFVLQSLAQLEASADPGGLPYRFIVKSLMPLSFALLFVQALSEITKRLRGLR
ncbi:MAG: TRAP transporter small permease subunit [Campylobacterales bacterium]|nr:TRAP transporter small permease subunit [Campylobacterales bacterium]